MAPLKYALPILALFLGLCAQPARGSAILYETRPYSGGPLATATDYVNNWIGLVSTFPTPPAGYGQTTLTTWTAVNNSLMFAGGVSNDLAFHTVIDFSVAPAEAGVWAFQFGIDFGWGGALYVDGNLVDFRNTDMWWGGVYTDPSQILSGSVNLAAGTHRIEIYGLEGGFDGETEGQYQVPGGVFQVFSAAGPGNPVPEPATAGLVGLALAGIAFRRRRAR